MLPVLPAKFRVSPQTKRQAHTHEVESDPFSRSERRDRRSIPPREGPASGYGIRAAARGDLGVDSLQEQQGGVCVPEIVKANPWQSPTTQVTRPASRKRIGIQGCAIASINDQSLLFPVPPRFPSLCL